MSLSTQTLKRLPTIKAGLLTGKNYTLIGKECGVTEKTIDRDVHSWVESGEFETWMVIGLGFINSFHQRQSTAINERCTANSR